MLLQSEAIDPGPQLQFPIQPAKCKSSWLSTTHCMCAEIRASGFSFYAVSCYFQIKDAIEEHLQHLETILHSLRGEKIVIGMDANARSTLWGSLHTDEKDAQLEALMPTI